MFLPARLYLLNNSVSLYIVHLLKISFLMDAFEIFSTASLKVSVYVALQPVSSITAHFLGFLIKLLLS